MAEQKTSVAVPWRYEKPEMTLEEMEKAIELMAKEMEKCLEEDDKSDH